jgi:hypothetical protein
VDRSPNVFNTKISGIFKEMKMLISWFDHCTFYTCFKLSHCATGIGSIIITINTLLKKYRRKMVKDGSNYFTMEWRLLKMAICET